MHQNVNMKLNCRGRLFWLEKEPERNFFAKKNPQSAFPSVYARKLRLERDVSQRLAEDSKLYYELTSCHIAK